jgi:hypothetical protein
MANQTTPKKDYNTISNGRFETAIATIQTKDGEMQVNLSPRVMGKDGNLIEPEYTCFSLNFNKEIGMPSNYGNAAREEWRLLHEIAEADGVEYFDIQLTGRVYLKKESTPMVAVDKSPLAKLAEKRGITGTTGSTGGKKDVNDAIAKLIKRK